MAKRKVAEQEAIAQVQEISGGGESVNFFEKYQNQLMYAGLAIAAAILLWFAYKTYIVAPKQKEAVNAMWQAQLRFEQDSFKLALENPGGGYDGFLTLADKFSGTEAGNTANYYSGVCYLQMGDFDNAIKFLNDFSPEGDLLPIMKFGALGDCYSEKKEFDKAISNYEKAVGAGNNELLTAYYLKKLGMLNEYNNNPAAANKAYSRIKAEYPAAPDSRDIDKYISRTATK